MSHTPRLSGLWTDEAGQDLVEYSLLLAFIALATVALLNGVSSSVKNLWQKTSTALTSAVTAAS